MAGTGYGALGRRFRGIGMSITYLEAIREAQARALKDDPRVSTFGPAPLNEGGAGVTIVELKG